MRTSEEAGTAPEGLERRRARLRSELGDGGPGAAARLRELAAADAAIRAGDDARRARELEGLARVHDAMQRLRACATPAALIEAAPRELCTACGFTRAMISRVSGSLWDPVVLEVREGADPRQDEFRAFIEEVTIPLDHMLLETDLVRRRVPALVSDAVNDPRTFPAIVEVSRSTSYVAAPILPTRRVIGFFHADRFGEERPCDEQDRDVLWTFAEHFGLLFERAVLVERLQEQRERLQAAFIDAAAAIAELNEAELELVRRGPLAEPPALAAHGRAGSSPIDALLTRLEREVIDILVTGATNAAVAHQLVVSEGTVKSHLKRILRKLHVTNRAEAVAKYLHILRLDEGGAVIPVAASLAPVDATVARLIADARTLLRDDAPPLPREVADADPRTLLPPVTEAVLTRLASAPDPREERALLALGLRTQDVLHELHGRATAHRVQLLGQVHAGLSRLRQIGSSADLLDKVCEEAVRSCGVRRVVLSRVVGSTWYPWMARFDGDQEAEAEFARHIRGITIDLAEAPIEAAVIEDGRPRIVSDATGPRGYGPMLAESGSTSYVVAPITPAGRVVGFLHADHHPDATAVDLVDREVLWAFAEGFGRIYERVELHERLQAQRHRVRETFALVESITSVIDPEDIELARDAQDRRPPEEPALRGGPAPAAIDELLTDREREVLSFMVRGLGNAAIAERLVIKEGTVKSHVKHILRKLGAANRAEVIALSMGVGQHR